MKIVVEHLEEINEWSLVEYKHIQAHSELLLSGCTAQGFQTIDLSELPMEKVLLLDPRAPTALSPEDAKFDYLLFGGILVLFLTQGDDPPQDRTSILRKMGFQTRHLGPVQMTTDTAALVAKRVVEGTPLDKLSFVDRPEIKLSRKESVTMPFRYLLDDQNQPIYPPGFIDLLKKDQFIQ